MEIKSLTQAQIDLLRKPLPPEAISPHPTKTYLSSIKAIYVVERLNQVFGIGGWKTKTEAIMTMGKMVVVKSVLTANGYDLEIEAFGGNDNTDLGDAHKGAATDALTKIGSYLEIGMDVFKGLHDKAKPIEKPTEKKVIKTDKPVLSDEDKKKVEIMKLCKSLGYDGPDYKMFVFTQTGQILKPESFNKIIEKLSQLKK